MGLQQHIDNAINRFLLGMIQRRGITLAREDMAYEGTIRWHEVPFESEAEWKYWWRPETAIVDGVLTVIRPARMAERERERYAVHEDHNLLLTLGRAQILQFMAAPTSGILPFAQYFAIGNGAITSLAPGDTSIAGEIFRAAPSPGVITGTQLDVATFIAAGTANGLYSNVGLWGLNSNPGINGGGTLMTHALSTYNKPNGISVTSDDLLNLF